MSASGVKNSLAELLVELIWKRSEINNGLELEQTELDDEELVLDELLLEVVLVGVGVGKKEAEETPVFVKSIQPTSPDHTWPEKIPLVSSTVTLLLLVVKYKKSPVFNTLALPVTAPVDKFKLTGPSVLSAVPNATQPISSIQASPEKMPVLSLTVTLEL